MLSLNLKIGTRKKYWLEPFPCIVLSIQKIVKYRLKVCLRVQHLCSQLQISTSFPVPLIESGTPFNIFNIYSTFRILLHVFSSLITASDGCIGCIDVIGGSLTAGFLDIVFEKSIQYHTKQELLCSSLTCRL